MRNLVRVLNLALCLTLVFGAMGCSTNTRPRVSTEDATGITATSANLNGDLTLTGGKPVVDVSFEWGMTPHQFPNETAAVARWYTGPFSSRVAGLHSHTAYYYRTKAVGDSTSYGSEMSFITP